MKDFFKLREELQSQQIAEDKHYGTEVGPETHNTDHPAVSKHVDSAMNHVRKAVSHAKKQGYKVNHKNEGGGAIGKQHSKPDVTVYGNDDGDTNYTVHAGGAAHKDKVMHSSKHDIKHDSKMNKHMYESVVNEESHLTMVTADGEEHHVIHGMAHNKKNAAKVRNAVGKAAAKHAGVSHSAMDKGYSDYTHHELAATAHTDKKPAAKGAPRYGGHGSMKVHKSVDAYVKHHAKNDAKTHKAENKPSKGRKPGIFMGDI